jgi:hypothetical protein
MDDDLLREATMIREIADVLQACDLTKWADLADALADRLEARARRGVDTEDGTK